MADRDHLDREVSARAETTPLGFSASAKSRAVAAFDRLWGNFSELLNVRVEADTSRRRAVIEGERKLIDAAVRLGVERMAHDEQFLERVLNNHFQGVIGKQANKDAVAAMAIEDLRINPPSDKEAQSGSDKLDEVFLAKFETYAEGATTEELRERWGKVLASEIRKPGTFPPKVLRVTDELTADVAGLFQRFVENRLNTAVPRCVLRAQPTFAELRSMVDAGLVVDPGGIGHDQQYGRIGLSNGKTAWVTGAGQWIVTLEEEKLPAYIDGIKDTSPIAVANKHPPSFAVYILTEAGAALSSILPDHQHLAFDRYVRALHAAHPKLPFSIFRQGSSDNFVFHATIEDWCNSDGPELPPRPSP